MAGGGWLSTRQEAGPVKYDWEGGGSLSVTCFRRCLSPVAAPYRSHVMLMDPWWNPAVEQQAQDRCGGALGAEGGEAVWRPGRVLLAWHSPLTP